MVSMERRGAGFAAFSVLVTVAAEFETGVAGLSALDLRIPFGVDVPFVVPLMAAMEVVPD